MHTHNNSVHDGMKTVCVIFSSTSPTIKIDDVFSRIRRMFAKEDQKEHRQTNSQVTST
jgi:hypothetical protein